MLDLDVPDLYLLSLIRIERMGLLDFFKGPGLKNTKCAYCKTEGNDLLFSKKFDGETHRFCSKDCSRKFRIARKKAAKKPTTTGPSMPW